ncbi:MAG: ATP-binding protein [Acidiphilium sp.]|nr:ATP-binding protein [Acidiphilium sp.]MDD4936687.1 ATP-binding protein [Acidiphilium sp.]
MIRLWSNRRGLTIMQRTVLLLLGLFIATEATVIILFHLYVLNPAASRFAEILIDAKQASAVPASQIGEVNGMRPRVLRSTATAPGHRPDNYFLSRTGHNVTQMTHGGEMRISRNRGQQHGTVWIKDGASPVWTGFPVSRFSFGASNFVLLRLIVLFGFTFIGSVIIVREVNRPLSRLAALAHKWGRGDQIFDMEPFGGPDEIRQVEQAIRGMAANLRALYDEHSVLLTGISHELRTPLSRLLLVLHLPDHKLLAQKQAMFDDVAEMDETLRKFLALVRNDSQERSITSSLVPFLSAMAAIGRDRYGLEVIATEDDLPPVAYKPLALERLVRNLFDNAARYGASRIKIGASVNAESVTIRFCDDGPGLPSDENAGDVFEDRDGPARKGSGVGMLLCRRIASLHGGSITFLNSPEGGLIAALTIPRPKA